MKDAFNEWWGGKGEKFNGKLDIKEFAREVWSASLSSLPIDLSEVDPYTIKAATEAINERIRQDEKWGPRRTHHPLEWMPIWIEEVGEVAKAMCEAYFKYPEGETWEDYRKELIHAAAVAIAMCESYDIVGAP